LTYLNFLTLMIMARNQTLIISIKSKYRKEWTTKKWRHYAFNPGDLHVACTCCIALGIS